MATKLLKPHFELGRRPIYLPDFTITLLKSFLPPTYARFRVPLSFNKLDLRDYLLHAYSLRTLHIRSSITQSPARKNEMGQLKRAAATKHMTAQLSSPFVWPEDPMPGDVEGVDRKGWMKAEDADEGDMVYVRHDERFRAQRERMVPGRAHREMLRGQARRLVSGEERWVGSAEVVAGKGVGGARAR